MTDTETLAIQKLDDQYRAVSLNPRDAIPSEIYHYTSAAGLVGILQSGQLRASNFNYLNDASEIHHGRTLVAKIISERLEAEQPSTHRHVLGRVQRTLEDVGHDREFYLACFCTKRDLLSQWRGYGSTKARFCIGFNIEELPRKGLPYRFKAVEYKRDKQRSKIDRIIQPAMAALGKSDIERSDEFVNRVAHSLTERLVGEFVFFKDWSFLDERELRAVHPFDSTADDVLFDVSSGFVRPYVVIWVGKMDTKGQRRLPVTEITVFDKRAVRSVELLLSECGYRDVTVRPSTVPYQEL